MTTLRIDIVLKAIVHLDQIQSKTKRIPNQYNKFNNYLKSTVSNASKIIKESRKLLRNVNKTLKADHMLQEKSCDDRIQINQSKNDEYSIPINMSISNGLSIRQMYRLNMKIIQKNLSVIA